jgi:putative ABC transport system permease protein
VNAVLRWLARLSVWLLPGRHRDRFALEIADTVSALAADARARGRGVEREYLLRELADSMSEAFRLSWSGRTSWRGLAASIGTAVREDAKGSLRRGLHRPAATVTIVVTLALVVTAVTTTFGLAHAVLWKPLPLLEAERLVFVWEVDRDDHEPFRVTGGRFAAWQRETTAFASLALFGAAGHAMDGSEGSVPVRGIRVSASFFDTLGMRPILGRGFRAGDEVPGQHRVLVVSHRMWQSRFGGRADIVGHQVRLSGEPFVIVGVMPDVVTPGWPSNPAHVAIDRDLREFWLPIARTPELEANVRSHVFGVVARLKPGVGAARADAELSAIGQDEEADPHVGLTTGFRDQFVRDARAPLLVLFAASLAVLLVACANLAALQVSLVERRRTELSMRLALGAGRLRLVSLLGMDALVPAITGLVLGLWWSAAALAAIPGQLPGSMPFVTAPALDVAIVIFACLVAAGAAIALSIWPVNRLRQVSPVPRGSSLGGRSHVYRWLVASQVAIGVALSLPAALLGQSLASLRTRDPGFVLDNVLVADIGVAAAKASDPRLVAAFEREVSNALAVLPGSRGVAFAYDHPLESNWTQVVAMEGDTRSPNDADVQVHLRIVSPSYFDTMDVTVLDGRAFEDREDGSAPGAVVVNEAFAAARGGRVIGSRLRTGAATYTWGAAVPADYAIVGVVENERFRGLEEVSAPAVYISTRQFPLTHAVGIVRGSDEPVAWTTMLGAAIRRAAPDATVGRIVALEAILAEQMATRRVTADVVGGFALAAVTLSALGLYGLMAVIVSAGRRETGVRIALGASPAEVARAIMAKSLRQAALGIAVGSMMAVAAGRFVQHLLVDVSAYDVRTLTIIVAVMLLTAVAAAALPAIRAARIDPASTLRSDA